MTHCETRCEACDARQDRPDAVICAHCGGKLTFRYSNAAVVWDDRFATNMWRYWPLLPLRPDENLVTLSEGGTPLHRSRAHGAGRLWFKDETRNPTGSHKDRALALGINHARSVGAVVSAVVSAGSTGLSHAAYAARAGMASFTLISDNTPEERAYPVFALGSQLIRITSGIDEIIDTLEALAPQFGIYVNSTTRRSNPYQSEASKTIAYEVVEQLGDAPDCMIVPVGGGGTIAALWRGFKELKALGRTTRRPRLFGVVPRNYNAIEIAYRENLMSLEEFHSAAPKVEEPTILSKLAHICPPDGLDALQAIVDSGGSVRSVTDEEALWGQERLARQEGIYVEPSSGAVMVALDELIRAGQVDIDGTLVAVLCGSGFRETFVSMKYRPLTAEVCSLEDLAAHFNAMATNRTSETTDHAG